MPSPKTLSADQRHILIAAVSGRALAEAARAAGFEPLVADFFADEDTKAAAERVVRLPGHFQDGIQEGPLLEALAQLASGCSPIGLVCGSGFERRPQLIDRLARRYRLLGNGGAVVAKLKDPEAFADLCRRLSIEHPAIQRQRPARPQHWLSKMQGAAGGWHIIPAEEAGDDTRRYFQQRVPGRAVSALFLANGRQCAILGFSRQWQVGAGDAFGFGGAVRPARISDAARKTIERAIRAVAADLELVGLNSADFLIAGKRAVLLEINPRPGATIDIFRDRDGRLFDLHVQASTGILPEERLDMIDAAAAGIVYAARDIPHFNGLSWPDYAHDRQCAGTSVARNEPFCTVIARAASVDGALRMLRRRMRHIQTLVNEATA